jgi:hypothetical protein
MYTEQELIEAIRNHKLIGRGSCTSIDECYDDKELWAMFGIPAGNATLEAAIKDAIESEDLHMEQGLNQRWGEDNDPQLLQYNEWEKAKADHESDAERFERELADSIKG